MITHVVVFTWRPGTAVEDVQALSRALDRLAGEVSALTAISHGPDLAFREGNGDYALIASFAERGAWNSYQADPRHKAFVRDFVAPIQASRVAMQFEARS